VPPGLPARLASGAPTDPDNLKGPISVSDSFLVGPDPFSVRHIRLAHEFGLGAADLDGLEIIELVA